MNLNNLCIYFLLHFIVFLTLFLCLNTEKRQFFGLLNILCSLKLEWETFKKKIHFLCKWPVTQWTAANGVCLHSYRKRNPAFIYLFYFVVLLSRRRFDPVLSPGPPWSTNSSWPCPASRVCTTPTLWRTGTWTCGARRGGRSRRSSVFPVSGSQVFPPPNTNRQRPRLTVSPGNSNRDDSVSVCPSWETERKHVICFNLRQIIGLKDQNKPCPCRNTVRLPAQPAAHWFRPEM